MKYKFITIVFVLIFALALSSTASASISTSPRVISTDPGYHAVNAPTNSLIKVTYNTPIKAGSMRRELIDTKGNHYTLQSYIKGNVLTIKHTAVLKNSEKYALILYSGCVYNYAGKPSPTFVTTFTTKKKAAYLVPSIILANTATMRNRKGNLPYKLTNQGSTAAKNVYVNIFLTPTKSMLGTKHFIGKQLISVLSPGRTINLKTSYFISNKIPLGYYYMTVVANKVGYSFIKTKILPYNPNY